MSELEQPYKELADFTSKGINRRAILRHGVGFAARRLLPRIDAITFRSPDNSSVSEPHIDSSDGVEDIFSPQDVHNMLKGMIAAVGRQTGWSLTGRDGMVDSYFYETEHFPIDTNHSLQLSRQSSEHPSMPDSTLVNFYEHDDFIGSIIYTDQSEGPAEVWLPAANGLLNEVVLPEGNSVSDYVQAISKWRTLSIPENHVISEIFFAMQNVHLPEPVSDTFKERILDVFDLPGLEAAKLDFLNQSSVSLQNSSPLPTWGNILSRVRKINAITGTLQGMKEATHKPDYQMLTVPEVRVLFERPLALAPGHIPQALPERVTSNNKS